jgi:hypothetical protein
VGELAPVKYALWLLVAACSSDPMTPPVDRHAPATCDQIWIANGFDQCEVGCVDATTALNAMGPTCMARITSGMQVSCTATFDFMGATGCCVSQTPHVYFADCQ